MVHILPFCIECMESCFITICCDSHAEIVVRTHGDSCCSSMIDNYLYTFFHCFFTTLGFTVNYFGIHRWYKLKGTMEWLNITLILCFTADVLLEVVYCVVPVYWFHQQFIQVLKRIRPNSDYRQHAKVSKVIFK